MKKSFIFIGLLISAIVLILWSAYGYVVKDQNKQILSLIDTDITTARTVLNNAADLVRRGGSDEISSRISVDCPSSERQRFDSLLDSLSKKISPSELSELEVLFYKCGRYYAEQKAIAAVRLEREVTALTNLVVMKKAITNRDVNNSTEIELWQQIAQAELQTAVYFNRLVTLQGNIISLLKQNLSATSLKVTEALTEVQNTRNQMIVLSNQIEASRTALRAL